MTRLSKEKWNILDNLLSEIGFGGYHDLIELLKQNIEKLEPKLSDPLRTESDLHVLILLMTKIITKKIERKK